MSEQVYYSQHGEDIIADRVFTDSDGPHYFVEVGMIDGRRFSNTLALEQRGWRGLCVEAHPTFVELVRKNRPNSAVIHAAASDTPGQMPFHADPRGDLSSLQPRNESELRERFGVDYQGCDVVDVPVRTLDDMLYAAGAPIGMEIVSIDIEGGEPSALRGFDLAYWRPRVLLIEADDNDAMNQLIAQLKPAGYYLARQVGVNGLFCYSPIDAMRVRLVRVHDHVIHTHNPVDMQGQDRTMLPSTYETRRQFALRWAKTFGRAA